MPSVSPFAVRAMQIRLRHNAQKLNHALARVVRNKRELTGLVLQKATAEVVSAIQRASPVDTGRFRGGWTPFLQSLGLPSDIPSTNTRAVAEGAAMSDFEDRSQDKAGEPFIRIKNGVPYGPELNAGKSPQAPAGFVGAELARFAKHLHRAALETRGPDP